MNAPHICRVTPWAGPVAFTDFDVDESTTGLPMIRYGNFTVMLTEQPDTTPANEVAHERND